MTHETEDTLLELALGLLDAKTEQRVRSHIRSCAECRSLFEDAERTISLIREAAPEVTAHAPALSPRAQRRFAWLRVAAMLAVGFGLGFVASESFRPPTVLTVRQQIIPQSPITRDAGFVICEEVDLRQGRRFAGR